jgi:hypothetical protein
MSPFASVQPDRVHQFLASKVLAANQANLFRAVGQHISVVRIVDGDNHNAGP